MVKAKLIRDDSVVYVSAALGAECEADIEDLFDPAVFDSLVRESYAAELSGKTLTLNAQVPRIVKRYELAFRDAGLEFNKTRPARLFLERMGTVPQDMLAGGGEERFASILRQAAERLSKIAATGRAAFR